MLCAVVNISLNVITIMYDSEHLIFVVDLCCKYKGQVSIQRNKE